jgi:hypothetical protein
MKSVWWTALVVCLVAFFLGACTEDDEENMWDGQQSGSYTEKQACGARCTRQLSGAIVGSQGGHGGSSCNGTCTREITIWYETYGTERQRSACQVHYGTCGHNFQN